MGPYAVHKQTKNKNFILTNSKHESLSNSVPLSTIKVIPKEVTDPTYIEKFLKDRLKNGIRKFFVKWQ
jgi:hypothetical protein